MRSPYIVIAAAIILLNLSCKKVINIDAPPNQLSPDKIFDNSSSALAATANIYTVLNTVESNFIPSIGTYTDELITVNIDATSSEFSNSVLTSANSRVLSTWQNLYSAIYKSNSIIEGLTATVPIPDSVKNQCLGEAKFMRAYCHFLLTNIYGDVPLITSTNVTTNAVASRVSSTLIYQQVISDLQDAVNLLPAKYTGTGEKIRANKWAAASLLAKALLYSGDYSSAETQSSLVINSGQYSLSSNLNSVFLANSSEAILQLWNASGFSVLNAVPASGVPSYQIGTNLLNGFESGDQRKSNWIKTTVVSGTTYYYQFKYKQRATTTGVNAEYSMYLRLGEVYLIRAEARARLNKFVDAASDLNKIRNRAGLPNNSDVLQADLITAILHERQVELFNEGGNRFFDLKRFGVIDATIKPLKSLWIPAAALFPVPKSERFTNPNLSQNPGYTN